MGFLGFGRPKWKHREVEVRLAAIGSLADGSQGIFVEIVRTDADPRVRAAAALRITDIPRLVELQKFADPAVKRIATERLSGVADQWLRVKPLAECQPFLDHITDQKTLAELSVQAKDAGVRAAAFARFTAQKDLSPALLTLVAIQDATGDLAQQALTRIDKRALLKDISRKAKVESVRSAAIARSEALGREADKPTAEQLRQVRRKALAPLLDQALRLAVSTDWPRATAGFESLTSAWTSACDTMPLDDETTALVARFNRARTDFIVRRDAEHQRLEQVGTARTQYLAALAEQVQFDPNNAMAQRQDALLRWSALGDLPADVFLPLQSRFDSELSRLHPAPLPFSETSDSTPSAARTAKPPVILSPEAEARLLAISEQAEGLLTGGREAKFTFQNLHKEWSKLAVDLADSDPRRKRFIDAYAAWKTVGKDRREQRDDQTQERLSTMRTLIAEAQTLATAAEAFGGVPDAQAVAPHAAACKELQARWKAVGPVRFELSQPLREQFRAAIDQAFAPVNATREAEDWERFSHLAHAEELVTKVLSLAELTDLSVVSAAVKQVHISWKQLGPLPREKGQEVWTRFKVACDTQFERCRPYFAELDASRATNLVTKQTLLAEFQNLSSEQTQTVGITGSPADQMAKRTAHERIKAIQAEWKSIGPVPREADGDLWRAWRDVCDAYFAKHREHLSVRNAEHGENLTRKLGLIVAVEDLASQAEGGRAAPSVMNEIKRLQQSWKSVGHVPKDQADSVWDKWRTACDRVYAALKPHLAELDAQRAENLTKKEAIIAEVEELAQHENAHWFKDDVRGLMDRWRTIGHIPREQMDAVNDRFHAACDRVLAKEAPSTST